MLYSEEVCLGVGLFRIVVYNTFITNKVGFKKHSTKAFISSLLVSYAVDAILIFLEYRDLVWLDITASAAGFYAFYYLLEYRILIIIATLTAVLATNSGIDRFTK